MQSQRILVTGGAGFLGSHLCERLLKQGHRVVCVDKLSTGGVANVAHLFDNPRFEQRPGTPTPSRAVAEDGWNPSQLSFG